jgi:hypothetical protein
MDETENNKKLESKEEESYVDVDWEDRSKRLKEKLKTMAHLRTKLWTRQGYHVVKSKKECRPNGREAPDLSDTGILLCGSSGDICIPDSSSSLGGVCALIRGGEEDEDETVLHEYDERKLSSRSENFSMLKPLAAKGGSKVMNILESGRDGYSSQIGEECDPGTNEGYVEVGAANPCMSSGHVCVRDANSKLGGTCVDIGLDGNLLAGSQESNLVRCTKSDGTRTRKCAGQGACEGTDPNKIKCGSCVSFISIYSLPYT